MADLSVALGVFGLGAVMCLWGYDKVFAQTRPESARRFGAVVLVVGFAYLAISILFFLGSG